MTTYSSPFGDISKDSHYMNLLFKMATDVAPVAAARIAAAIVYKKDVVSFGINQNKTHPLQAKFSRSVNSIYIHAEIDAIKNAVKAGISLKELSKATLYICRAKFDSDQKKFFIPGLARPCENGCTRAVASFGINRVVYSLNEGGYTIIN
jgi:deoxycytidylate deaminase